MKLIFAFALLLTLFTLSFTTAENVELNRVGERSRLGLVKLPFSRQEFRWLRLRFGHFPDTEIWWSQQKASQYGEMISFSDF